MAYKLLSGAKEAAKNEEEKQMAGYFLANLKRFDSIETKQSQLFTESSREVMELANSGYPLAQFTVGKELIKLSNAASDRKKKEEMQFQGSAYMLNCAKAGFANSFFYMGWLHEQGLETIRDLDIAYEWYLIAAAYDDPQAYFRLSQMYPSLSAYTSKDTKKTFSYLKKAAELGLMEAQHNLAVLYKEAGEDMKALAWHLEAAKQGFYPSVVNLGTLFLTGIGEVHSNPMIAYIWLSLAKKYETSPQLDALISQCETLMS